MFTGKFFGRLEPVTQLMKPVEILTDKFIGLTGGNADLFREAKAADTIDNAKVNRFGPRGAYQLSFRPREYQRPGSPLARGYRHCHERLGSAL